LKIQSIKQILEERNFFSLLDYGLLIPFDIFWVKSSGKKTLLKRKGDFGKVDEIKSYQDRGVIIDFDSDLSESWLIKTLDDFGEFFALESRGQVHQNQLQEWRKTFVKKMIPSLWENRENVSRLDICFGVGTCFYDLEPSEEELFLNFPLEIQKKNYLTASYGVMIAIFLGYTNTKFLKEYFSILLFMDYPFCLNMWSESEKSFLLKEWMSSCDLNKRDESMRLKIKEKYFVEVGKAKKKIKGKISFKGLAKYLEFSFERINGSGFPAGLFSSEMSDLDALTVFLYHRFSFDENSAEQGQDGSLRELLNVTSDFREVSLSKRIEILLKGSIDKVQESRDEYLAISGL
jgi:hypothetical protein